MSENKQNDRVKEITDQLEQGLKNLFQSKNYMNWLKTMSKFHEYSLNNTLLITLQKPEATLVAGYTAWQKQFHRQVKKGEKGIRILAPSPYKAKVEEDVIDPVTKDVIRDSAGNPVKEVKEVDRTGFRVVSVFDISQTEGPELPMIGVDELNGEVKEYELFFQALKNICPVSINFERIENGAKGYFHHGENRIAIQENMPQQQTIKTLIHEMAHQKLHSGKNDLSRSGKEVEAESVAFTVCSHFGIDTSEYSFPYIAVWSSGKELKELRESLDRIRVTASEMISGIEQQLKELLDEKEKTEKRISEQNTVAPISFFVTSSVENPAVTDYKNLMNLDDALIAYGNLQCDNSHGGKGLGFILNDSSICEGLPFVIMQDYGINEDVCSQIRTFRENELIQEAVRKCREYSLAHSNTVLSPGIEHADNDQKSSVIANLKQKAKENKNPLQNKVSTVNTVNDHSL